MQYRTLPNTDIDVSTICLGTMTWGQQNSEAEAHEQLDYATSNGVNFIDTAEIYPIPPEPEKQGTTERYLGSWIKKSGKRDSIVLASKVTTSDLIRTRACPAGGRTIYDRENIRAAIEGSLERLQTDHLDLYQVHRPERKVNNFGVRNFETLDTEATTPIEETLEALTELVKEGKVRAIGISNETPWGTMEYIRASRDKGLARISTIQNQYSLLNRSFEIGLSEVALQEHVGLLAWSPLSAGVLTGKYLGGARPDGARFTLFSRNADRYNTASLQPVIAAYVDLAKRFNMDPATLALSFAVSRPFMTSVIIGATSLEQLKTDIDAGSVTLTQEHIAGIDAIYRQYPDVQA